MTKQGWDDPKPVATGRVTLDPSSVQRALDAIARDPTKHAKWKREQNGSSWRSLERVRSAANRGEARVCGRNTADILASIAGVDIGNLIARPRRHQLVGFWSSSWTYGSDTYSDLINLSDIDPDGTITGQRAAITGPYNHSYILSGLDYGGCLHLIGTSVNLTVPVSVMFILTPEDNSDIFLSGFAVRPLGTRRPLPVLSEALLHRERFWAQQVTYERIPDPVGSRSDLWKIYEKAFG